MKKLSVVLVVLVPVFMLAQVGDSLSIEQRDTISGGNNIEQVEDLPYIIKEVKVTGTNKYSKNQIMRYTGLYEGEPIEIPGLQVSNAVKKLWESKLFSDIEIYVSKIEGRNIFLRVDLKILDDLGTVKIEGVSKSKSEKIIKENNLKSRAKITDDLRTKLQNTISVEYAEKGYPDAKAIIKEYPNPADPSLINWNVSIDKGVKAKVRSIKIEGLDKIKQSKIRSKAFKNTRQKVAYRFWKRSKYVPEKYEEDLNRVVETLQSYGFRDAEITKDTVTRVNKKNFDILLKVNQGQRYYLGDITFSGNTEYSSELLSKILGYKKGEPYDAVGVNKKVSGSEKNDDIATLYYNNGYVFSSVVPVEKAVKDNVIDVEVKINEGDQAYWDKVTFSGNTKTHDHVIQRMLRTMPGRLFSKEDVQRTLMELAQTQYFNQQSLIPNITPNPQTKTVDIEYKLEESGTNSQVELQGGYGGNRFIGTLGLTFGNFSFNDFFNKKAWKPVPLGDGQSISLRAQAASNYQNYSISFTEPWITGKRPTALSVTLYTTFLNYTDYEFTGKNKLNIYGIDARLSTRLNWPDDYFRISYGINYQMYSFKNYPFTISDGSTTDYWKNGESNNFSFNLVLGRYSAGLDPIFPTMGSEFEIALKFTPPYSAFSNKDYKTMSNDEKYKWLEYYKIKMKAYWYRELIGKLVIKAGGEFGFLNGYNSDLGAPPFERYYMGGTGMYGNNYDGREIVPLRGYKDPTTYGGVVGGDITAKGGGTSYSRFMLELRYPLLMAGMTKIYALAFAEGGNVWTKNSSFSPFELKRSAGFGFRVFMPQFGMLGFDFARGFDSNIGSVSANGWETHFIFGQQF